MMPLSWQCAAPARRVTVRLSTLAVVALLAAACGGKSPAPVATRPTTDATVGIVSPTAGQVVSGSTLHVILSLTGGQIIATTTATPLPGNVGHIHLLDNGSVISMAFGTQQDISLTPGTHLLEAEFVASDHLPFSPRVIASVHITDQ